LKRRIFYKILLGLILYFFLSTGYKVYKNTTISETCLTETFNVNFSGLSKLEINSVYDFDDMFKCQDWDEIYITDAIYYFRGIGYITSGVLVPEYDVNDFIEGGYLIYFLKNGAVVSNPIQLYGPNFILSQSNGVRIKRDKAKFHYKKFEHSYFDMNTFEILEISD
jgi:hypothetical protein